MHSHTLPGGGKIPALGLGTWKAGKGQVYSAVREAIDLGYRHIDCAPIYQNEAEVGRALQEAVTTGTASREELWITSKLWNNAHAAADVQPALEQTLSDLRLAYLDLFLIHWPVVFKPDAFFAKSSSDYLPLDSCPVIETWQAMEACVGKGLARYIGVCNFSQKKLDMLFQQARIKPSVNQIELHPYLQQTGMLSYCQRQGILLTGYSPLGSGDRPKVLKKKDEPVLLDNPVIAGIAARHQATPAQVLLAWGLARQTIVIPKSVHPARLAENLAAANLLLDGQDLTAIAALDQHYRFVDGSFFQPPGSPYSTENLWDENGAA